MSWFLPSGFFGSTSESGAQQAALEQQMTQTQQSAQQSGLLQSSQGAMGGSGSGLFNIPIDSIIIQDGAGSSGSYYSSIQSTAYYPPYQLREIYVDPLQNGHDLLNCLIYVNPTFIKEIIVTESVFKQVIQIVFSHLNEDEQKQYEKEYKYHNGNGVLLIKNEKYQFDLDKYIEESPEKT